MPFETVVRKTIEYLAVPSVVGHEGLFTTYLEKDFQNLGLNVTRHNGVLEISGNAPCSCIISAHIDRHGLISLGDGLYAYAAERIRNTKYGEDSVSTKKMLEAISDRFEEEIVFAYDPATGDRLGEGVIERAHDFGRDGDAYFHVAGMRDMPCDTPIAYARSAEANRTNLKGQIDNVVSLGMIYTLFQNGFRGTAALTCEEEIGKSWLHMTNWLRDQNINTHNLLILDTSPYREDDPVKNSWIVLRNRDKSGVFNKELVQKIKDRCTLLSLPFQVKDEYFLSQGLTTADLGSTELGRIVENAKGQWNGATIQIPTTEYHTSYETTSRGCIESYYALLNSLLIQNSIFEQESNET